MAGEAGNLAQRLFERAATAGWGDRVALREPERAWTWGELEQFSRRMASVLRALGVVPGDRVAVFTPDTLEAAGAILGSMYTGAVAVPLSELATPNDIRDCLADCGAVVAIVDAALEPTVDEIRNEVSGLDEVVVVGAGSPGAKQLAALVAAAEPAERCEASEPSAPAVTLYSAGMGDGKRHGVVHSHDTPFAAFESYARDVLGLTDADRVFSVVRLSTAYGLGCGLLFPLMAGAEAMLLPDQPHSDIVFSVVDEHRPTVMCATPSVYGQLARDAQRAQLERPLASLRAAVSGAEGMPLPLVARVRDSLGVEVSVGYGLTEAFQFVIACRPNEVRPGSCGKPVPGVEARVVDHEGTAVGVDEIGTLELRGPTIGGGDWFRTRDRFMVDADGYFIHCGRIDDLFKVGGKWVTPGEVEQALLGHEAVWECAVIGADDEDGLVKPLAFVVPNIGHAPSEKLAAELREHVKNELAPYKYPRWIEFVDELPKGPTGKVLRYKLQPPPSERRRAETSAS